MVNSLLGRIMLLARYKKLLLVILSLYIARIKLPLGIREERAFRKAYVRYFRILEELSIENAEDLAATLATAEILISMKRIKALK